MSEELKKMLKALEVYEVKLIQHLTGEGSKGAHLIRRFNRDASRKDMIIKVWHLKLKEKYQQGDKD